MAERTQHPPEPDAVHPDCRDFVSVVELLLARRRAEQAHRPAQIWPPAPGHQRRWHRTELEDTVYSSYKQMRQGRITRPPRRDTVMAIADYLNCTLIERNQLLLAARAAPVSPYLIGEHLAELLPIAIATVDQLTIPAIVINRDWSLHYQNALIFDVFMIEPTQLALLPPPQRNLLQLLFDPALPLRPVLAGNHDSWTRMVRQTIYGFKLANLLCQFEPWYAALVERLLPLPDFADHWHSVSVDAPPETAPHAPRTAAVLLAVGGPPTRWLRPLLISTGYFQFDFPIILAFLPADPPRDAADELIQMTS